MKSIWRTRVAMALGTALCLGAASRSIAAESDGPPLEHLLQWRGQVLVGDDGNGVTSASFPTTVAGDEVRYVLLVDNGCDPGINPCPAPVMGLTITLNDDVVFQNDDAFDRERVQVALNPPGAGLNHVALAARGGPNSGARAAILALRPAQVPFGGRSILPLGFGLERDRTLLTVHNAGPSNIAFRLVFFNPDGSLAGHSAIRNLANHATVNLDLFQVAGALNLGWTRGAVHVQWASHGFSRVSTVANEVHRDPDATGILQTVRARTIALDDYGPHMLNHAESLELLGN